MKIKHGMILAAGKGKRLQPLTTKIPKPLLKINGKTLLERAINLLIDNGVSEICVNIHHLGDQIENYILNFKSKANISISNERNTLLDTGGGVQKGTKKFGNNPFFIINPDTLWNSRYSKEINFLEKEFLSEKKPCMLLVKKDLSFDSSFRGDFNLKDKLVSKDESNQYIYTGLQIIKRDNFAFMDKDIFSMNDVWKKLIDENNLCGVESNEKFYHLNTLEMFKKIASISSID